MTREELIAALEKATGPDRELDAQLAIAAGDVPDDAFRPCASRDVGAFGVGGYGIWVAPLYTASIDAAVALVPRNKAGGCWYELHRAWGLSSARVRVYPENPWDGRTVEAVGESAAENIALALCLAALKARK